MPLCLREKPFRMSLANATRAPPLWEAPAIWSWGDGRRGAAPCQGVGDSGIPPVRGRRISMTASRPGTFDCTA